MLMFKGCRRCGGTLERTTEGDVHCLQCGRYDYAVTANQYIHTMAMPGIGMFRVKVSWHKIP